MLPAHFGNNGRRPIIAMVTCHTRRDIMEGFWGFVIIGGPIILGLALLYGTIQYRKRDRRLDQLSQDSARKVREDIRRDEEHAGARR